MTADRLPRVPPSGIPEMDAAHARLWERLRELLHALEQAPLADAMAHCVMLLTELRKEYAGEEALMAAHRYPGMTAHRASHALLEAEFSGLARAIRDAGSSPTALLRARLAEILIAAGHKLAAHVLQVDVPLARFARAAPGAAAGRDGTGRVIYNLRSFHRAGFPGPRAGGNTAPAPHLSRRTMLDHGSFGLGRWFATVALAAIATISVVTASLLSSFLTARMLQQEGRLTQEFVQSIIIVEKAADYFSGGRAAQSNEIERAFEHIARMPDVLRANLHSRERQILWSSDRTLIGHRFDNNPELEEAIGGRLVVHGGDEAKVEHGELDYHRERFIEIYSPVWDDARRRVVGVVELYKAPRALFEALQTGQRAVWIGAAVSGFLLYAALFGLARRADNLIRQQRERLVQSETLAAIGEMGSAVAHGIRNPLANIRSSAELSLESNFAQWRNAAHDIVSEVDRLESWVRELLSYSQPLSGRIEPIRVDVLVRASLQSFERELQKRGIEAILHADEEPPLVTADPLMLRQVFNSLIANAVEAVEGNGCISVSVLRKGERQLRVSIEDNGPGLTREQLENAFRPFHTTKPRGVGVGLPLARRIVDRFGGSITMSSEPGKGTTIDVLLPVA